MNIDLAKYFLPDGILEYFEIVDDKIQNDQVHFYLEEKNKALNDASLQSPEDKRKFEDELYNIKKILKDLYERREKKIVNLALDKSRTNSNLIDVSGVLDAEKGLFESLTQSLDSGRSEILAKILESKTPSFEAPVKQEEEKKETNEEKKEEVQADVPKQESAPVVEQKNAQEQSQGQEQSQTESQTQQSQADTTEKPTKMVRFVNAVPKFVGKELEEYGPFDEEDVANLPTELANVLIEKGRVEEIQEG